MWKAISLNVMWMQDGCPALQLCIVYERINQPLPCAPMVTGINCFGLETKRETLYIRFFNSAERVWLTALRAQQSLIVEYNSSAILLCQNEHFLVGGVVVVVVVVVWACVWGGVGGWG